MQKQQLSASIKRARDIMRKDAGLSSDLDRTPQLAWILFLKSFDELENKNEKLNPKYRSAIEVPYRWRDWAANDEGKTGNELLKFVNDKLLPHLRGLKGTKENDPRDVLASLFMETHNRMLSGYLLREVANLIDQINFQSKDDIFTLSHLYESILKEMRDAAGTSGEFYTPRPVVRFIVEIIKPKIGEKVLDPACGTGGFLVEAYEYMKKQAKTAEDWDTLQYKTLYGIEKKPMPYLLGTMNLILHGIEVPNLRRANTLTKALNEITEKDKHDVIITNPPFGGEEEKGIQDNFPASLRTSETALLFLQFITRSLKNGGRCGIVVPDSMLSSGGVCQKIREQIISDTNLHSVIRLPEGVFSPYTGVPTNILIFEKGNKTKNIWFYQLNIRDGIKAYSKTKPFEFSELEDVITKYPGRIESENSWIVDIESIIKNNYSLNLHNPNKKNDYSHTTPTILLKEIEVTQISVNKEIGELKDFIKELSKTSSKITPLAEVIVERKSEPDIYKVSTGEIKIISKIGFDEGRIELRANSKTRTKMILIRPGDLVISGINVSKGAVGYYSENMKDDIAATIHYSSYIPNRKKINVEYLWILLRSQIFRDILKKTIPGGIKSEIKASRFLKIQVPICDLPSQIKIVSMFNKVKLLENKLFTLSSKLKNIHESILYENYLHEVN